MKPTNTNRPLRTTLKGLLLVYVTAVVWLSPASAVLLVDSGTPTSGLAGFGVSFGPLPSSAVLAQAFSLSDPAFISTIEVYMFAPGDVPIVMQMQLTSAIGPAATAADLIGSFSLPTPPPLEPAFVSSPVNLNLQPGTYFLVFSAPYPGAVMPDGPPNDIGDLFAAFDDGFNPVFPPNIDMAFPPASNFSLVSIAPGNGTVGVRIEGNVIPAVPDESSTLVLFFIAAFGVCGYSLWCRKGAAQAGKL
jgi:hypothetical protein